MEKIIKKAEEVCKTISKSLEEADYNNFRIDFAISTLDGELYKIIFLIAKAILRLMEISILLKL